jgi:hypothetical protein
MPFEDNVSKSSLPGSINTHSEEDTQAPVEDLSQTAASSSSSSERRTTEGLFECNICLEMASEPVVTLCGHLFW